jgi:SAM-dependent methyltransferase
VATIESWLGQVRARRARRALARQWAYQQRAVGPLGAAEVLAYITKKARAARALIESVAPMSGSARVLEVGCGPRGIVFCWDAGALRVGVDPLAVEYAGAFGAWQRRALTCAAGGESLPFANAAFDVVLCDNVIDHAGDPEAIVRELARVLAPGGVLYFTVNVHHPVYRVAAWAHAAWSSLGIPVEIGPFADHTVHLTLRQARRLVQSLPVQVALERDGVAAARSRDRSRPPRHAGDRLKRLFFKNARYQVVARRLAPEPAATLARKRL